MKETHTFKLETNTLQMLKETARKRGVSPNALAERILSGSLKRSLFESSFNWIAIGKETLRRVLESIDPKVLAKVGFEEGRKDFALARETVESYGRDLTLFGFVVETMGQQARWFEVEGADVRPERIILRHRSGMNWSIFLKSYIMGASEEPPGTKTSAEIFEDFVRISFGQKNRF